MLTLNKIFCRLCVIILSAAAWSCNDGATATHVPLPEAWPRLDIEDADTSITLTSTAVPVRVNAAAMTDIIEGHTPGLTVSYPRARAHIYYTFIPIENENEREHVIENRKKRFSLNLNGIQSERQVSADGKAVVLTAGSGSQTPVLLLASLPKYVVSATAFIDNASATTAYDSVVPVIKLLKRDVLRSLPDISFTADHD